MRLQQIDTAIPDTNIFLTPAFFQHDGDKTLRDVKLTLCPAFTLIPRLFERQRLLVVNDRVMCPRRLDAFGKGLHGELHILRQARCTPTMFFEDIGSDAHARTAEAGGQADIRHDSLE